MSYLLDRKQKRKKIAAGAGFALAVLLVFYFRSPLWRAATVVSHAIFTPVLKAESGLGAAISGWRAAFNFKKSLIEENENLKNKLKENEAATLNHAALLAENTELKETLGRKLPGGRTILAAVLAKPNKSLYDTLVIDAGGNLGVKAGQTVFAYGNVPIGRVAEVFSSSAKVVLYSTADVITEVVLSSNNGIMELVGRGGGNFEMILPRDLAVPEGAVATLPGLASYVVATFETTISDPRDSATRALLTAPVNLHELRFVQVSIN